MSLPMTRRAAAAKSAMPTPGPQATSRTSRSEERRVGKECRSRCDCSSDVCSSDLSLKDSLIDVAANDAASGCGEERHADTGPTGDIEDIEIGRASCRERV